jgi:glycosyltransferase involved in cell wall biosynthesis
MCKKMRVPYGIEVIGDPWDAFSPGASTHPLRLFFRHYFARALRNAVASAAASSFVTERALQMRYPPNKCSFSTYASSVELYNIAHSPRTERDFTGTPSILFVGSLNHLYKAPDILLRAFASLCCTCEAKLTLVGDGKEVAKLKALASQLGIAERTSFLGALPNGRSIFEQMDRHWLFVLPSRQEGLPRAAVEAMSRAMPVVLSAVGGNSELVPSGELVARNDPHQLADAIRRRISSPHLLVAESARNLQVSQKFVHEVVQARRRAFYGAVAASRNENCNLNY